MQNAVTLDAFVEPVSPAHTPQGPVDVIGTERTLLELHHTHLPKLHVTTRYPTDRSDGVATFTRMITAQLAALFEMITAQLAAGFETVDAASPRFSRPRRRSTPQPVTPRTSHPV